jgi:beta-1,4-mannosyl-glycoprotein beta-1,4-N-acetylglucosaminyltransferase
MKIYDCVCYFDEDLILDIRLNILYEYVDKFIILESKETHQGQSKKLNFNINRFKKFKKKINYFVLDKINIDPNYKPHKPTTIGQIRDQHQRNHLAKCINDAEASDWIMISDIDEIPNPNKIFDFNPKKKFAIFEQKMFYYKFNLLNVTRPKWFGTRICVKKFLTSPQELRNEIDKTTFFKRVFFGKNQIITNGGWHFSFIKTAKGIQKKIKAFAHIEENTKSNRNLTNIKKKLKNNLDIFNRNFKYKKTSLNVLPNYIIKNKKKFSKFII